MVEVTQEFLQCIGDSVIRSSIGRKEAGDRVHLWSHSRVEKETTLD